MIFIEIQKEKQNIITIEVSGHSGYAEAGQDIVCAAVSSLTQSLINGLTEVVKVSVDYVIDEEKPYLRVTLPKLDENEMAKCQILMHSTYLGLKEIANGYPKFIKLKEKQ